MRVINRSVTWFDLPFLHYLAALWKVDEESGGKRAGREAGGGAQREEENI